jgi:hypothetical protein
MEGAMMSSPRNRRIERREQLPMRSDEGTMQMAQPPTEQRPVEGRSLRYAGDEAKLGPSLAGVDSATLLRVLLPRAPIDTVDPARTPGATVAAAMLDTAYQLK